MCLDGLRGRLSYVGGEERDADVECRDGEDGNSNIIVVIGRWVVSYGGGEVRSGCGRLGLGRVQTSTHCSPRVGGFPPETI